MEGVRLDELSSSDTKRLEEEYNSSRELSSLGDDSLLQLTEDLGFEV